MKIMIADDDDLIIALLSEYLTGSGHTVATAYDAASLVKAVQEDAPGLIFLDINMDGIRSGGLDSARVELPAAIKSLPIVAITGNEAKKVYQMGLPPSIPVISKPIDFAVIDAVLAKFSNPS